MDRTALYTRWGTTDPGLPLVRPTVRFTPVCECRYPLLRSDKKCPRCGVPVPFTPVPPEEARPLRVAAGNRGTFW